MRVKTWLISLAKLAFAAGLIYWLVHSGKISFEPFKLLAHKFWLIPFALISTLIMLLVNNYRWVLLLHGQEVLITQWDALKLSFIGLFFNLAMPGSVGGDVLKGYYITQIYPDKKVKVATSVLIDRLAGLYSIVVLAFLAVLFEWSRISNIAQLRALAIFVLILAAALSTFLPSVFPGGCAPIATLTKLFRKSLVEHLLKKYTTLFIPSDLAASNLC